MWRRFVLSLVTIALLTSCASPTRRAIVRSRLSREVSSTDPSAQAEALLMGQNEFALDLYRAAVAGGSDNLVFSPYSIYLAFSMVYAGARGETADQMQRAFCYLLDDLQHPALNALTQQLAQLEQVVPEDEAEELPFRLNMANAIWGQEGFPFADAYLDTLARYYGAELQTADFAGDAEAARRAINAWAEDETEGRIEDLAPPGFVKASTVLVLANAIYFRAAWVYRFPDRATEDGPFTLLDGSTVTVPLMHNVGVRSTYLEGDDYQCVRLPYRGRAVEMWVILPAEGRFADVEADLSADWFQEAREGGKTYDVILTLPRFDFESSMSLPELLRELGVVDLFAAGGANLSAMADAGGLSVSDAIHKANITVMEEGTEAAAATAISMPMSAYPIAKMTVDRPFLFAIVAQESGSILFLGRVTNPAA